MNKQAKKKKILHKISNEKGKKNIGGYVRRIGVMDDKENNGVKMLRALLLSS